MTTPELPARIKRVSKAWGWLLLALGVITLGLRGYVLQRLQDGVLSVGQIVWLTLPLVGAVAIMVYRARARLHTTLAGYFGILVGTLAASVVTGISSGDRVADALFHFDSSCIVSGSCGEPASSGDPISLTVRVIGAYFQVYGVTGFLSAIVVGAFFGYAFAVLGGRDRPPASS
jgi:hypothetical protein